MKNLYENTLDKYVTEKSEGKITEELDRDGKNALADAVLEALYTPFLANLKKAEKTIKAWEYDSVKINPKVTINSNIKGKSATALLTLDEINGSKNVQLEITVKLKK